MTSPLSAIHERIHHAAGGRPVKLLAVSKTRSAAEVAQLAAAGQRAFGENYVQEACGKIDALAELALEWHLIGQLQSNKCRQAAERFDWVESLDRAKLVEPLARYRPVQRPPLNILIQVNIDDEASKAGCLPEQVAALAAEVAAQPRLQLRGLMAIPAPLDSPRRAAAFAAMAQLFTELRRGHPNIDTLSMGMSDDFELAIAHGSTEVRLGSALFGPRG